MTVQSNNSASVSDDHGIWQIRWMIALLNKEWKGELDVLCFYMWRDIVLLEGGHSLVKVIIQ